MRAIFGRRGRLEDRYQVREKPSLSIRVLLVHPEKGVTGVLLIEGDKPTERVLPTPEEVEKVPADLERRQAAACRGMEAQTEPARLVAVLSGWQSGLKKSKPRDRAEFARMV